MMSMKLAVRSILKHATGGLHYLLFSSLKLTIFFKVHCVVAYFKVHCDKQASH